MAAAFTAAGAVWIDGTGLFASIPKADKWHAENSERTRKAFAIFMADAPDMGEFVNAGKALRADMQALPAAPPPVGGGSPWGGTRSYGPAPMGVDPRGGEPPC